MLIGFDSIIILNDNVCSDFMSGELTFNIIQKTVPVSPKANCFLQNSSVIQYISPVMNENDSKLKFSVSFKGNELISPEFSAVVFSRKVACTAEIRKKDGIISLDKTEFSAIKVSPSSEDGFLDLVFISEDDELRQISDDIEVIKSESSCNKDEIARLKNEEQELKASISNMSEKKEELILKIAELRSENDELESLLNKADELKKKNQCLKTNFEKCSISEEKISELKNKLGCFGEILDYYRSDEGYKTVLEKTEEITAEIDLIGSHLQKMISARENEINSVSDELNI